MYLTIHFSLLINQLRGDQILLDEADIFLEERDSYDISRNAMVS